MAWCLIVEQQKTHFGIVIKKFMRKCIPPLRMILFLNLKRKRQTFMELLQNKPTKISYRAKKYLGHSESEFICTINDGANRSEINSDPLTDHPSEFNWINLSPSLPLLISVYCEMAEEKPPNFFPSNVLQLKFRV